MSHGDFRKALSRGYGTFRGRRLREAIAIGAAVLLPALVLAIGFGMVWRYRPLGGWIVPAAAAAGLAAALWTALVFHLRRRLPFPAFLRHIEGRVGLLQNELVLAEEMERRQAGMEDPLARGLAGLTVQRGRDSLADFSFRRLAPSLSLRRPALAILASAACLAAMYLAWPAAFTSSAVRLARPGYHELPPSLTLRVEPGDVTVERGSSVQVRALAGMIRPSETPRLLYRPHGAAWHSVPMLPEEGDPADTTTAFTGTIRSVLDPLEYAVAVERSNSPVFRVSVVEPLRAAGYQTSVEFPPYTGLSPVRETRADANLSALVGSMVRLTVLPSRPGARGWMIGADGDSIALEVLDSGELFTAFRVRAGREYSFALKADSPVAGSWLSGRFTLDALADRMPTLVQINPEQDATLPPDMKVILDVDCLDDFGLTRLDLVHRRNDGEPHRARLANWKGAREARVLHPWNLEGIALIPGDVIRYHLELTDNDAVTGPKTTIGPECSIRFPSFDEMYAAVREDRLDQMADARDALERQQELRDELLQIQQELMKARDLSWEQQEQIKDMADRQQKLAEAVEEMARSMEKSLDRMEQANLFTPEMLEKVQQINQLAREVQSPEFHAAMQKLHEAMKNLDRDSVHKALQELQLSQEEIQRSLDQTLEMLKQLKREEALDSLIRQAERLTEEQRLLNEQLASHEPDERRQDQTADPAGDEPGPDDAAAEARDERSSEDGTDGQDGAESDDAPDQTAGGEPDGDGQDDTGQSDELSEEEASRLQERQDALREELSRLQEQMEALRREAEENWQALKDQMQQNQAEKHLSAASESMQSASQSMSQCSGGDALRFGRMAEQQMEQFALSMRQSQEAMRGEDLEELARELYRLSGNLVQLSKEQEELLRTAPARPTRDLAVEQVHLGQVAAATLDRLFELGRQSQFITPELGRSMGEAIRHLHEGGRSFDLGDRGRGMRSANASMQALDGTVIALLNTSQNASSSSCPSAGGNPLSRMRSLSGEQESLNRQMQQMLGQMQGDRLSMSGSSSSQVMDMAARQEAIRRGLREVEQSVGDRSDILGRLGDIGSDMEEVVADLRDHDVDERILQRQQRILSRLLTAQRSLRQQGEREERLSRPGQNPENRLGPAPLQYEEPWQESLRRGILRGSQDPVPGEYRRLVDRYFRTLGGSR